MSGPFEFKLSVYNICSHIEMNIQINDNNYEAKTSSINWSFILVSAAEMTESSSVDFIDHITVGNCINLSFNLLVCSMGLLTFCLSPSTNLRNKVRKSTILYYHFYSKKSPRRSVFFCLPHGYTANKWSQIQPNLKPGVISVILYLSSWYSEVWWSTEARVWKCLKQTNPAVSYVT